MEQCAFCQIVTGERKAHLLYENDQTVAFLDQNPAVQGHTLVVPKTHREFLFTDDESVSTALFQAVYRLSLAMNRTLEPDGVSLFYTSAELIGNITHAHVHLLPRYADDTVHLALERESLDDDDASQLATRIRAHL